MTGLWGFPLACTVYLCVKQTMFFMSKTYLWLHNIEKDFYKLVQILWETFTTTHRLEKTSATCNNKRWLTWFVGNLHVSSGLKHGLGGWLLVIRKIFWSYKINWYFMVIYILRLYCFFLIFPHIFPTQQKNFCSYWRIFLIIPYPPPALKIAW